MQTFFIDFIAQIIEQTLLEEHIKNKYFVGGENELKLYTYYEQLVEHEEVDRYVETFKELANQQNRGDLIANGILSSTENPTITNLNKHLIVPLNFLCAFRITLADTMVMQDTINNLINIRKGRKVDICETDKGDLFVVGTVGNNVDGTPLIKIGDYLGELPSGTSLTTFISGRISALQSLGFALASEPNRSRYYYYSSGNKLKVAYWRENTQSWDNITDNGTYDDIIFPPEHNSFTKYKVSISFDATRCDTPQQFNGNETITLSFSGSATIVDNSVMLGNDLTKVSIKRYGIIENNGGTQTLTTISDDPHWLEPLELPSSSNADTQLNRLASNNFLTNTHTDSLSLSLQYTFIVDRQEELTYNLFKYARYGTQTYITPNIIYEVVEIYSYWGEVDKNTFKAKIVESIDIENTESDTLTITLPMQIQGANN